MSSSIDRHAPACLGAVILSAGLVQGAPAAPPQATTFQITPDHAGVTTSGGTLALQTGDAPAAIDLIGKAIAVNPTYAPAHYNLGNALRTANRSADAIASYKQAIALKPTLAEAHFNLGSLLLSLQRLDEALANLESALARPVPLSGPLDGRRVIDLVHLAHGSRSGTKICASSRWMSSATFLPEDLEASTSSFTVFTR